MTNEEMWKSIEGYEGLYEVSNFGRVRSLDRRTWTQPTNRPGHYLTFKGKILKIISSYTCNKSYKIAKVSLSMFGNIKTYSVAVLVAQHFLLNPNNFAFIKHLDGNPFNNKVDNLMWVKCIDPHVVDRNKAGIKKLRCIETGETYASADIARESLGFTNKVSNYGIRHAARYAYKNKTYRGYHFEYVEEDNKNHD